MEIPRGCTTASLEGTAIAELVCQNAPDLGLTPAAVERPSVGSVEALGAVVAGEDPQHRVTEAALDHSLARFEHQAAPDASTPMVWSDIESEQLADVLAGVRAGCSYPREPTDRSALPATIVNGWSA
jgi:hypothetical protein